MLSCVDVCVEEYPQLTGELSICTRRQALDCVCLVVKRPIAENAGGCQLRGEADVDLGLLACQCCCSNASPPVASLRHHLIVCRMVGVHDVGQVGRIVDAGVWNRFDGATVRACSKRILGAMQNREDRIMPVRVMGYEASGVSGV